MTIRKHKLELTWIGKENRPKLEPRILLEDREKSYHASHRVTEHDLFDSRLIFGDNLLALKALEQEFTGKIKCIYIDPPFNTGQAMEHYDDGLEHSIWLSLIRDRIELLYRLLTDDGTIVVHIDDNELGYLLVLMDEVFQRSNRISVITFKQGAPTGHKAINPGCVSTTNFLIVYSKQKALWRPNRVFVGRERDKRYNQFLLNPDEAFERWKFVTLTRGFAQSRGITEKEARSSLKARPDLLEEFVVEFANNVIRFAQPDYDAVSSAARELIDESSANPENIFKLPREEHSDMYFVGGERILFYRDKLKSIDGKLVAGEPLTTLWDDLLSNNLHNEGGVAFPKGKKPESLLKRILDLTTRPGDWVLDSFGGSGTTGAVAHKLGRRWIMIELREHCDTHILPRMRSVIDGTDTSGITKAVGWKGGGGFRYYHLAPSLLEKDKWGNWVVNKAYNPAMLAQAVCKLEGFTYEPSDSVYWQQGHSTERDFIYVTTQNLSHDQLQALSDEVGEERSLLVLCPAFRGKPDKYPNLTVKKIPKTVLSRCEWGHDDYSLKIENLPKAPIPSGQMELLGEEAKS
ncbi:DNA methylase N-4/N-6 domain protein [Nitrospira sp. ND1]|uniref:site-specific DNA-methyltransferase n=1 Tax=Nitrospira sp. ND1 TaxID=1658518 RepID=UPI0009BC0536|nr:site-specific DNA-methyltransferase [Nitrospira sp. ND1]SLM44219.1 DNA methylase N-4/N-6 domain protein [Nitrospira sp. ND1]